MDDKVLEKVMEEVKKRLNQNVTASDKAENIKDIEKEDNVMMPTVGLTEFVGTAIGDTVGLVIANVDSMLHEKMGLDKRFRSIGILGARTGAGPQIMAADEGVKATNTEIVSVELARDTKGGAGHGSLIIFGAEEVSDARRAIEVSLKELNRTFGDVYTCDAGHLELQYTARASYAINKAFGAPVGKAFGLIVGAPAAIGVLMSDTAVKTANVEIVSYASPGAGTAHSNEVIISVTGDSGAVRQAVIAAREVGMKVLKAMGQNPVSTTQPYI